MRVAHQEGQTVISVDRVLDRDTASRVRAAIERCIEHDAAAVVIVDVSQAREVTPVALATLVDDFELVSSRVRFRGLSQHAARILRHLTAKPRTIGV